jgi:hypothetical protein
MLKCFVMRVLSNMKGWCQELMKTPSGPSYRGVHLLGIEAFYSMGDLVAHC